jgi:hypothetical protein
MEKDTFILQSFTFNPLKINTINKIIMEISRNLLIEHRNITKETKKRKRRAFKKGSEVTFLVLKSIKKLNRKKKVSLKD